MSTNQTYEQYMEEMDRMCGRSVIYGPTEDAYGVTCDLEAGHRGPHEGDDAFVEGKRAKWTGGGMCAGDPLPVHWIH